MDSRVRVLRMHERTNIRLSTADRRTLEAVVANRNSPQKHVWRAKIVLLTASGHGTAEIMQATGNAKTVKTCRHDDPRLPTSWHDHAVCRAQCA
jgi:hypothetical protein